MEEVSIIGIDLAKRSFQLHGARADGSVAFRRKLSRGKLLDFVSSQPRCAMAAGVTDRLWDIEDIVRLVDEAAPKPGPRGPYQKRQNST